MVEKQGEQPDHEASEGYAVLPDLHGQYELAARALENYDFRTVTPVFLGDFIDIGPDSAKLITLIREAHAEGAVVLAGNHEWVCRNALAGGDCPEAVEWRDTIWPGYEDGLLKSYGLERTGNWQDDAARLGELMDANGDLAFLHNDLLASFEADQFVAVHAGPALDRPWSDQRMELERAFGKAERLICEPEQLFSFNLAGLSAVPEHVDQRRFVTGHAHLSASAPARSVGNRICLGSQLASNQSLYVWESWHNRIVEITRY